MIYFPRTVYFKDGKAIGAGVGGSHQKKHDSMEVIFLPSDHYDFIGPIKVCGKTKAEIENEAATYE